MFNRLGLYNKKFDRDSCGVGFITRKDGTQTHQLLKKGHEALCSVPHRGGMSSEGVGDGAGVSIDLSKDFFSKITSQKLILGNFCVGNFFLPNNTSYHNCAEKFIIKSLNEVGMKLVKSRLIPVDEKILRPAARKLQLSIKQFIFKTPTNSNFSDLEKLSHKVLLKIEAKAFTLKNLEGLYPLSLSTKVQVLKGRLNSHELIPYFKDLSDPYHKIHSLFFHTRFSTNTDPHPSMAQPFRLMAHNGELNTDNKNRLSEDAIYKSKQKKIIRPKGQSDSCRFDQTLKNRISEDDLDIVSAIVGMMPPAWENNKNLPRQVRAMFEFFSLYEEKNDGPAAVIFGDGQIIGSCLDRLGLRPLRTVETKEYISVMSEAGQIKFPESSVIERSRIEAGGILFYDHKLKKKFDTKQTYELLSQKRDYIKLLRDHSLKISELENSVSALKEYNGDLNNSARYAAYYHNQESLKFLIDPILEKGVEKVSAMGYGNAINALSPSEGGMAKYFSHRFSQVTNPPLDPIRESDGMTLRVALGPKVNMKIKKMPQIIIESPILSFEDLNKIKGQNKTPVRTFDFTFEPNHNDQKKNQLAITNRLKKLSTEINKFVQSSGGIIVLTDRMISSKRAAIPMILTVSAINQSLISAGLRFKASIIVESGQISSPHHVACALGFGGSAVYSICSEIRSIDKFSNNIQESEKNFRKACEKSLMKIMGKVGLCTVESYSGGEFFEPNYLNTKDIILKRYFPNLVSPVGGVGFSEIAQSISDWHKKSTTILSEKDIPIIGLFKERAEGAGHSYGLTAVKNFLELTEENISFERGSNDHRDNMRLLTLNKMYDSFGINEKDFNRTDFRKLTSKQINDFKITPGYRTFSSSLKHDREKRPVALRDVLSFPVDFDSANSEQDFIEMLDFFCRRGNDSYAFRNLLVAQKSNHFFVSFPKNKGHGKNRINLFASSLKKFFGENIKILEILPKKIKFNAKHEAYKFFSNVRFAPKSIGLNDVQKAKEITKTFASGAMSHGALVASAHEAIAHGTNMVGALSNSGEGGEHPSRYGTIRASRIKQLASGRFGVWTGYLADPMLEEIEIKIAQGAKPGEGGQLPAAKVTVEIASARNGTPGVELVSPPPHHDTYSIEDLAQLIHDAKAARVKVIVKLVSSVGIGTIAVGVAKAGADIINIAGGTGGTGAANVTSLKYAGRSAEIGLAEVHQALCANNIRQKVLLRCSGAHQTGSDVVKSALLGADSFEFGTTAMMMMKCVMAKNCNIKCPAGLTTNAEVFNGDPRILAQFYLNVAHEVREILAEIGLKSLQDARGRSDLLNLINTKAAVGQILLQDMLHVMECKDVKKPIYLEKDFRYDDEFIKEIKEQIFLKHKTKLKLGNGLVLSNKNKTFGGQLSIDLERILNHENKNFNSPAIYRTITGRNFFAERTISIATKGSAGQSFAAFCNTGMQFLHKGTCNDGVGKSASGGEIIIRNPSNKTNSKKRNVLIGNFALFGATGGRLFVDGEAGDRFAVRNSGASAVVEGVGEYCAEYMTNGTILNLGSFSRGFGNGMSGGFAYQYDNEKKLIDNISKESVNIDYLNVNSELSKMHEITILDMLHKHLKATKSKKANYILQNWDLEKFNMAYVTPKSLLQYQDYEEILNSKSRDELVSEFSRGVTMFQVENFKKAWRDGDEVLMGDIPENDKEDNSKKYKLLNSWTVLNTAQKLAQKIINDNQKLNSKEINKIVRDLILTEDFRLINNLLKHSREAVARYQDKELAVMIANNRLNDFKKALSMRSVLSMDSLSTYGWIIYLTRKNRVAVNKVPNYEELFYNEILPDLIVNN